MSTPPSLLVVLAALVLAGSACGGEGARDVARDRPGTASPSGSASAPVAPVPTGPVSTRTLATMMDTGSPELCLGPVAESYPPQCSGLPVLGWEWADHEGTYDRQGDVRWGSYLATGTWDGTAMTVTDVVPGALYDAAAPTPTPTPPAATAYPDRVLEQISDGLRDRLPGYLGSYGGEGSDGHVFADVVYDDGSLQAWADATYGAGVVVVTSALVDAGSQK